MAVAERLNVGYRSAWLLFGTPTSAKMASVAAVSLRVRDLPAALAFYQGVLGMHVHASPVATAAGATVCRLSWDDCAAVELI